MIHAYAENYLFHARNNFALMLDSAVNQQGILLADFYRKFLEHPIAERFAKGEPDALVGHSGTELMYMVIPKIEGKLDAVHCHVLLERTPEYWTGWALAYYQWRCGWSFQEIDSFAPIERVRSLYHPYHEMDISHFAEVLDGWYRAKNRDARLKTLRLKAMLSQAQLAIVSGVPLRTIQQYEQFQKNINAARGVALLALANALHCPPAQLLEPPVVSQGSSKGTFASGTHVTSVQ